jgi:hypothetical protein
MFKKPTLIILLLMFITAISSYNAYAQPPDLPNIKANWNNELQQISVTWDKPLAKIDSDQDGFSLYRQENGKWKHFKSVPVGTTGIGIKDVDPNTEYILRLYTSRIGKEFYSNEVSVTTTKELKFACWANCVGGKDIRIGWHNATGYVNVEYFRDGNTVSSNYYNTATGSKKSYQSVSNDLPGINHTDKPQKGETWEIVFSHDGKTFSHTVFCGTEQEKKEKEAGGIPGNLDDPSAYQIKGPLPIFTQESWPVVMFWYVMLASLSGVFIFLAIIRSGYQYMFSATSNPGLKASFSETIEKCIIALVVIMTAPMLIGLLIQVNDGLVKIFADVLNNVGKVNDIGLNNVEFEVNFINKMIAWPFKLIFIDLPNKLFGLHPLSHLIFNNETDIIDPYVFAGYFSSGDSIDLGDPLASVLVAMIFAVFNIIFNAIYTIRGWVVTAVLCATPLIVWIWVVSSQKTVIEIWLSELFQTIFMQTWHALTFAIVFSILLLRGNVPTSVPSVTDNLAELLIMAGKFFAAFGGVICVGIIIYCSYELIINLVITEDSKHIAEYKANLQKALIGLVILSLALIITQAIFPHEVPVLQPNVSGGHTPSITLWQIFFAFFVILPISKMLSNIFMSLLARFGTVDEQALGTQRGFGMIGGLFALGAVSAAGAKGAFLSNERQAERIEKAMSPGGSHGSSSSPHSPGSASGFSNSPHSLSGSFNPGSPGGSPTSPGSRPGGPTSPGSSRLGGGSGNEGIFTSSSYDRSQEEPGIGFREDFVKDMPGGSSSPFDGYGSPSDNLFAGSPDGDYTTSTSGLLLPKGYDRSQEESGIGYADEYQNGYSENTGDTSTHAESTQSDRFRKTLADAGLIGSRSMVAAGTENTIRGLGYVAGSVVGQGQAGVNIFGPFGKQMGNAAKTFSTGYQVYKSVKGESRTQTFANLRELTGKTTNNGAIMQAGIGVALTPLGSHKAASIAKKTTSFLDYH